MSLNKLYRRGTANVNAKLTPTRVAIIRRLGKEKEWTVARLASLSGVSTTAVQKVLTRQTWADVDDDAEIALIEPLARLLVGTPADVQAAAQCAPPPTLRSRESISMNTKPDAVVNVYAPDVGIHTVPANTSKGEDWSGGDPFHTRTVTIVPDRPAYYDGRWHLNGKIISATEAGRMLNGIV